MADKWTIDQLVVAQARRKADGPCSSYPRTGIRWWEYLVAILAVSMLLFWTFFGKGIVR